MTLSLLLFADLHLTAGERRRTYERPDLAGTDVDAVVTLGDVLDDHADGPDDDAGNRLERRGRAFFEHVAGAGVPTIVVPGDRDPLAATRRLVDGLESVVVAHDRVVTAADFPGDPDFGGVAFVGHGCEAATVAPTLPYTEFDPVDPRTTTDEDTIAYVADDVADQVEAAVGGYLSGSWTVDDVGDELGVHGSARDRLAGYLDALADEFEAFESLLGSPDGEVVALSHVPPFNTSLDYTHSFEALDERVHRGSLALAMAIAAAAPMVTLAGHVHQRADDAVESVRGPRIAYSPGSPGVVVVEVDPVGGSVDVEVPSL